jgi:hypothetical protein
VFLKWASARLATLCAIVTFIGIAVSFPSGAEAATVVSASGREVSVLKQAPDPRYKVVATWKDSKGATVYLRQGSWNGKSGWGYGKISKYHNLSVAAVRTVTKYPQRRAHVAGQKYNYYTPVEHVRCSGWWVFRRCKVVEAVQVTVGVDFRSVGTGSFGVVTAFCSGSTRCPDWVKQAANVG